METTVRKVKFFLSMMKEKHYLEEMAQKGYFLRNMTAGVIYTFEVGTPQRIVYDVDRFNLPPNPSLKDIQQKETFVSFAEEMGWQEVTHDEDMNYYFCKPYEENGVNEIYDTDEGRRQHAEKYKERYIGAVGLFTKWMLLVGMLMAVTAVLTGVEELAFLGFVYMLVECIFSYFCWQLGNEIYKEMRMGYEQWLTAYGVRQNTRKIYRCFLTTRGLTKFLQAQSAQGWHLVRSTAISYCFEKGPQREEFYLIDSKSAVNRRRLAHHQKKLSDRKDINQINNDWQVISVQDAEKEGLVFACAYGNRQILYRSSRDVAFGQRSGFLHAWLIYWLIFFLICFMLGFVVGLSGARML